ncbi:MAG: helix-turn-helix transcriptional regulator [Bacteroidaceae bacterium]|nr:helix-turn-helix transcriptional regulator [Bacteroidaceae bacterium]
MTSTTKSERFNLVYDYLRSQGGIHNQTELSQLTGISRSNISSALNKKEYIITRRFIRRFNIAFNGIFDEKWMFEGEGEMLHSKVAASPAVEQSSEENMTDVRRIPLLPVSAIGGSLNEFVGSVQATECEQIVSPIRDVDFAVTVSGDSMYPEYPNGSHVFVKKINEQAFIEWGRTYVLDTCNGVVIKLLVPSEREGYVRCVSINQSPLYPAFDVAMSDVYGFYLVKLCMSVK